MAKFVITERTPQPYRGAMRAPGDVIEIEGNAAYEVRLGILAPYAPPAKKAGKARRGSSVAAAAETPAAEPVAVDDVADGPGIGQED